MDDNDVKDVVKSIGLGLVCLPVGTGYFFRQFVGPTLFGSFIGGIISVGISYELEDFYSKSKTVDITPNIQITQYSVTTSSEIKKASLAFLNPFTIFLNERQDYTKLTIKFGSTQCNLCTYKLEGKFNIDYFRKLNLKDPDSVFLSTRGYSRIRVNDGSYEKNEYGNLCDTIFRSTIR